MSKTTVINILDAIGDAEIADALGVSLSAVRSARWKGIFPALWYSVIREMCHARGLACPEGAFNFKYANPPHQKDAS